MNGDIEDNLSPQRFAKELWGIAPLDWVVEFFLIEYKPRPDDPKAKSTGCYFFKVGKILTDWTGIARGLQHLNQKRQNIHPSVNPRFRKPGGGRGKNSDVKAYVALWLDLDFKGQETAVRAAWAKLLEIFTTAGLRPSVIVESGRGIHVYWLLDKPYPNAEARPCCAGLQKEATICDTEGGGSDPINDPCRVLRMPGTDNWKDLSAPHHCKVVEASYKRYPLSAFADYKAEVKKSAEDLEEERIQKTIKNLGKAKDKDIERIKEGVGEGERDNSAAKYAGYLLAKGLPPEKVQELLLEWNQLNRPPLEKADIERIVASVARAERENHPEGRKKSKAEEDEQGDILAARQFVEKFGQDFLYCDTWKKWLVWDSARWGDDELLRAFGNSTLIAAASDIKRHKAERISATLRVAQPLLAVSVNSFNKNPWILNCQNGALDLKEFKLTEHRREDRITALCPTPYDPEAKAPLWEKFLLEIMGGNQALVSYLQKLAGYSLTGVIREHVLPIAYGSGANGKSTFLKTLRKVMGSDYAAESAPDLLLTKERGAHPTERADLAGKRFVTTIEVEDGRHLAENFVKQLTGGDEIKVRRMRENFWTLEPTWKIFMATNNRPEIKGMDFGVWRRIRLIPFSVTIPPAGQDPALGDKLAFEAPGILAWAIRGCQEWQRVGLQDPPAVTDATNDYKVDSDIMGRFFSDCCVILPTLKAAAGTLYELFKGWYETEFNGEPMSGTAFGRRLTELGFGVEKLSGKKFRIGIGIAELSLKTGNLSEF